MVNPDDEDALRLGMFAASLLVIALRENVLHVPRNSIIDRVFGDAEGVAQVADAAKVEARAIADTVVEEAKRLNAQRKTV